jgi:choline transport protein
MDLKRVPLTISSNGGGWSSTGLSCLVGLASPIWCFIGPDAGAHMSEELKDASITLPKAMLYVLNDLKRFRRFLTDIR